MVQIRHLPDVSSSGGSQENDESNNPMVSLRMSELEELVTHIVNRSRGPNSEPLNRQALTEIIAKMHEGTSTSLNQNSGNGIHRYEPRNLELRFQNNLPNLFWTGVPIKGEDGTSSVKIALVDGVTSNVVNFALEVEIVLLRVDLGDEGHLWTTEDFNGKIVREWRGQPLLKGNTILNLKEGVGSIDNISFTHGKKSVRMTKYRLGARTKDNFNKRRVREAKSEIFVLKDSRNKRYVKHPCPTLDDAVWRLRHIDGHGPLVERLNEKNITTVRDFLIQLNTNPQELQDIFLATTGMSAQKWEVTVENARACILDPKLFLFHPPGSQRTTGVVFNIVGQVMALVSNCQYVPLDKLSETDKEEVHAVKLWKDAVRFGDKDSLASLAIPYDDEDSLIAALSPMGLDDKASLIVASSTFGSDDEPSLTAAASSLLFNNDQYSSSAAAGTSDGGKIGTALEISGEFSCHPVPQPNAGCSADITPTMPDMPSNGRSADFPPALPTTDDDIFRYNLWNFDPDDFLQDFCADDLPHPFPASQIMDLEHVTHAQNSSPGSLADGAATQVSFRENKRVCHSAGATRMSSRVLKFWRREDNW